MDGDIAIRKINITLLLPPPQRHPNDPFQTKPTQCDKFHTSRTLLRSASTLASVRSYLSSPTVSCRSAASKGCNADGGGKPRTSLPNGTATSFVSVSSSLAARALARCASFFTVLGTDTRSARLTAVTISSCAGGTTGRRGNCPVPVFVCLCVVVDEV